MRHEVAVVGGGPAGSTAAMHLARDHDVLLIEEHPISGEPAHCAGLVTPRGVPEFARGSVVSEVRGARLHSPLGFTLTLEAKKTRACVLDRADFDRCLFERAVDSGAKPLLNARVLRLEDRRGGAALDLRMGATRETAQMRLVVGADGARSVCRRDAGLPQPRHLLRGIQADLRGARVDPDVVDLYFGEKVAPGFFAWSIPAGELTRVGLCTWRSDHAPAVYLKRFLSRADFAHAKMVSKTSGLIPVGPGRTAAGKATVLVGDAACHAKPLSGGGVFTGIRGGELCAEVVHDSLSSQACSLSEYDRLWKDAFGKELVRAFRVRKVFLNLADKKFDKALRIFAEPEVRALLEDKGDVDYPTSLSHSILKLAPKLAQFSPQIIESLL